jgi:hypothetical protein
MKAFSSGLVLSGRMWRNLVLIASRMSVSVCEADPFDWNICQLPSKVAAFFDMESDSDSFEPETN